MAEKINHGRSKLISSYGGVGSVIDTPDASIIVETFDNWGYPNYYDQEIKKHIILDDRLINRLRVRFPKLKHLVSIPVEEDGWKTDVQPQANYFPKWFYCSRCKRFMPLKQWKDHWQGRQEFDLQCFNPECKGEHLEQIRFVMTCDDGHIQDLPWEFWNNREPIIEDEKEADNNSDNEQETKSKIKLKYEKCCSEQELYYKISNENTDLSGIHIECKKCNKSATLKGLFGFSQTCGGRKYWLGFQNGQYTGDACEQKVAVKIKTSNSVYYANTLSSLWIPEKQKSIESEHKLLIERWLDRGKSQEDIVKDLFNDYDVPREITIQYLEEPSDVDIREIVYRKAEYDYFFNKQQPADKAIRFRQINVKNQIYGFEKLVKIDRLKKITVQTSFTRNAPIDTDSILIGDSGYEYQIKRQSVSKNSFETHLLPAIENYGEGILFVLDEQKLKEWEKNDVITARMKNIQTHSEDSDWQFHKIEAKKLTARKILIHTLSHLLIREFEYICGYPMSSLQERLYVSENMNGFLISAYDGTDGYLGGLTKLCNNLDKLQSIITSALQRAKDCSLDPICYENEGQGIAQLNLAACHSCTLVPDISCEMSNLFLDRRLVIDTEFGYFKNI
jgi:hypothetical protein